MECPYDKRLYPAGIILIGVAKSPGYFARITEWAKDGHAFLADLTRDLAGFGL